MSHSQLRRKTSEPVEEYLEALWLSEERGHNITKISWVAKQLGVAPSSVFEMLKKLEADELLTYHPYQGVTLTAQGKQITQRIIRNHRLVEVLMNTALRARVFLAVFEANNLRSV